MNLIFLVNAVAMGVALAMDAFSVSIADALSQPRMPRAKMLSIAGTFAFFQIIMPLTGWFFVHTAVETFTAFQKWIPWIALVLLLFIGGKMLLEAVRGEPQSDAAVSSSAVTPAALLLQGIATSIDALSVGFTISDYSFGFALVEALIIGIVTFLICICGLKIGKQIGEKVSRKATAFGGLILIGIGLEIFIRSFLK